MAARVVLQAQPQWCQIGAPSSGGFSGNGAGSGERVRSCRVSLAHCPSARGRIGASGRMGAGSSALHGNERWRKVLSATAKPKWGHTFKRSSPRWTAAVVPSTKPPAKRQSEQHQVDNAHSRHAHNAHSHSASTNSSSPSSSSSSIKAVVSVASSPPPVSIPREPVARRLFASFSKSGRKRPLWKQAGMWIAGAVTAAVGVQVSAQVLDALDKVPFLADLEVLVGTGVALNFLSSYVTGGPARARVESSIESIVDAVRGTDTPTDSDLQSQIQQLLEETAVPAYAATSPSSSSLSSAPSSSPAPSFAARVAAKALSKAAGRKAGEDREAKTGLTIGSAQLMGERGGEEGEGRGEVVLVKKQSLISRLVDLVRGKEVKTKRATLALQAEAARSQALQSRTADLNQSLQASKRAAQAAAQKLEELRAANGRLQEERGGARAAMGGLQQEVAALSADLENLTADSNALKRSKEELASKVQATLFENQSLQARLESAKALQQQQVQVAERMRAELAAAEARLREREEALQSARAESAVEKTTFAARLESMKKERDEALAAVVVMEGRLAAVEATLQQATQARTDLFKNNAELKARLEAVLQQNRDLATQAARMEESGRQVSAVFEQREGALVQQIRTREADLAAQKKQAAAELAGVESRLEGALRKAEEEKQKYMEACDWLEKQLATLKAENETTIADLRSSLAFAEQRAKEEAAKVVQLRAELDKQTKDAARHKAALQKKVAELEGKLGSSQSQLSIAEKALATATAAANRVRTAGKDALAGLVVPSVAPAKGAAGAAAVAGEEEVGRKGGKRNGKAAVGIAESKQQKQQQQQQEEKQGKEEEKERAQRMREGDLKVYARAIFPAYVDVKGPTREQSRGVNALVQDLVGKGAEEQWARNHVAEALLKPALSAAAAVAKTGTAGAEKSGKKRVTKEALQSYARAIQHAYIDATIPAKEQQAGMQLLVQELVAMGGEEEWARSFVKDSMPGIMAGGGRK
ncbi:hypothetical protein CLOP_g11358 [Closterium sp. NIES-67]|nr:hypothetical protein CLOP_g11358 [Closterium sp. NIES-67]